MTEKSSYMRMKCEIEHIEGEIGGEGFTHKFIINREGDTLKYYSHIVDTESYEPNHRRIAEMYGCRDVLGGGFARVDEGTNRLVFHYTSDHIGPVPETVLRNFEPELRERYKGISTLPIEGVSYCLEKPTQSQQMKWDQILGGD